MVGNEMDLRLSDQKEAANLIARLGVPPSVALLQRRVVIGWANTRVVDFHFEPKATPQGNSPT
jgi:hypothetical protein